jgi:hypothetical protein
MGLISRYYTVFGVLYSEDKMILLNNLGRLRKGRLWLNDFPDIRFEPIETLRDRTHTSSYAVWERKSVCLELLLFLRHVTNFGLLGIEYIPDESNHVDLEVSISKDKGKLLEDSLANRFDKVHLGLPRHYADIVFQTANEVMQCGIFPPGSLKIAFGAYAESASNDLTFSRITRIMLKLIGHDLKTLTYEDAEKIILLEINREVSNTPATHFSR